MKIDYLSLIYLIPNFIGYTVAPLIVLFVLINNLSTYNSNDLMFWMIIGLIIVIFKTPIMDKSGIYEDLFIKEKRKRKKKTIKVVE